LEHQLTDFVLQHVGDVDSPEALENLEDIAREIEDQASLLCDEYVAKAREAENSVTAGKNNGQPSSWIRQ